MPDARGQFSAYIRADLIVALNAITALRRDRGERGLRRSHVVEEAFELWLAVNSQKYDYRMATHGSNGERDDDR